MALFLPDGVRVYEASEDQLIHATLKGDAIINAASTAAQGSPNMTVNCAAGTVIAAGAVVTVAANAALAISAADPALPRIDLVHIDLTTGVFAVTTGTPNATPKPPALPANKILSAYVSVAAAALNIQNSNITDMRLQGAYPMVAGTLAGRPSATFAKGMSYFATDDTGGTVYRTDGAVWVQIAASVGAITSTNPNLVLNSDFGRRTVLGLAMPEVFADTSAWQAGVGTLGTVASNILTAGSTGVWRADWKGPNSMWRDGRWSASFKATDVGVVFYDLFKFVDVNNFVAALWSNSTFVLNKTIAGSGTTVASVGQALTVNQWYWLELEAQGTTYIAKLYSTGVTTPGTLKSASTLLQTLTGTIADASVVSGGISLQSSASVASQWGGIATGNGGVYVETWLPESQTITFGGTLGGQALGYDDSADSGPLGKQWAMRAYVPVASRTIVLDQKTPNGSISPSVTYAASGYSKVSGLGGSGTLVAYQFTSNTSADGVVTAPGALNDAGATSWTRRTVAFDSGATARKAELTIYINSATTATGTAYFSLPQLEQGSAATAWRNAPADDGAIIWNAVAGPGVPVNYTTTSLTMVEPDSRDLAFDVFLPWDATVVCNLSVIAANSTVGQTVSFNITVDGATIVPGTLWVVQKYSAAANDYSTQSSCPTVRLAAGKHRIALAWDVSANTGTLASNTNARPVFQIAATRGK